MTRLLLLVSGVCLVGGAAALIFVVSGIRPIERPRFGRRGFNRAFALRAHAWFRYIETPGRHFAASLSRFLPEGVAGRIERSLSAAGYPYGLTASELVAWSGFVAAASSALLIPLGRLYEFSSFTVVTGVVAVGAIPFVRLSSLSRRRMRRITLRLPSVLELIVMCMSAGLDLPRSLRCVVDSATDRFEPIVEELETVVRELELGRTRREALRGLAERAPSPEIEELVHSVIQSEEKGVSLASTLAIQSRTSRLRRSMQAEQAASGAALMLVGPMSLIFLCVIALLLGPVLIRTMSEGFGA